MSRRIHMLSAHASVKERMLERARQIRRETGQADDARLQGVLLLVERAA